MTGRPDRRLMLLMEDAEAIRQVLEGDIEAFATLVRKYHGACVGYARRMLRSREMAEDVVQETFLRAFRGLRGYDDRGRFGAWLFRILCNRCRSAIRVETRWDPSVTLEDLPGAAEPRTAPRDCLTRMAVEAALLRLGPQLREAFLLHHVEELSYEEMAFITGAGISALKMRVARARECLRREFADEQG